MQNLLQTEMEQQHGPLPPRLLWQTRQFVDLTAIATWVVLYYTYHLCSLQFLFTQSLQIYDLLRKAQTEKSN
jgi:hypothetical protein